MRDISGLIPGRTTHGMSKTPEYKSWVAMRDRCNCKGSSSYSRYGGVGITVCQRWDDFLAFYEDMGPMPSAGCQIDRINNNGNYEPENCRWVTRSQNCRNRRSCRILTVDGVTKCLSDWADDLGVPGYVLTLRLNRGWSEEDAVKRPLVLHTRKQKEKAGVL